MERLVTFNNKLIVLVKFTKATIVILHPLYFCSVSHIVHSHCR